MVNRDLTAQTWKGERRGDGFLKSHAGGVSGATAHPLLRHVFSHAVSTWHGKQSDIVDRPGQRYKTQGNGTASILPKEKNSALFHLARPFQIRYASYSVLIARYFSK
jgi:hypothetical protein